MTTLKKITPVWYGGSIGNDCNVMYNVGHLSPTGLYIPKYTYNEFTTIQPERLF